MTTISTQTGVGSLPSPFVALVLDFEGNSVMVISGKSEHGLISRYWRMVRNHEFEPYDHVYVIYAGSQEVNRLVINTKAAY